MKSQVSLPIHAVDQGLHWQITVIGYYNLYWQIQIVSFRDNLNEMSGLIL